MNTTYNFTLLPSIKADNMKTAFLLLAALLEGSTFAFTVSFYSSVGCEADLPLEWNGDDGTSSCLSNVNSQNYMALNYDGVDEPSGLDLYASTDCSGDSTSSLPGSAGCQTASGAGSIGVVFNDAPVSTQISGTQV